MSKTMIRAAALGAAVAIGAAAVASGATARELRFEPALPCTHDVVKIYHYAQEEMPKRTGGALTMRNYCGSLMGLN
jgi:TRAP-type C4-dicarboxylate transport system substrate-binding protein